MKFAAVLPPRGGLRWVRRRRSPLRWGSVAPHRRRVSGSGLSLGLMVFGLSCIVSATGMPHGARAQERLTIAGFAFSPPDAWIRQETASAMRAAQFAVPNGSRGYDGVVIFYRFPPGLGGSAERNIARWYGQFKEPKETLGATVETRRDGDRRFHYFRATGTLIGRDGDMPGYALHAALLDGPDGRVFVRFVAPNSVAQANRTRFRDLVNRAFDGGHGR